MNKVAILFFILVGLGLFLWLQRDEIVAQQSSPTRSTTTAGQAAHPDARYIIREKIKPGGYIGWHDTEQDRMTSSPAQTRQASNYYLVCTEMGSGTRRIFHVSASAFNMERIGNVLTAEQVRSFREVSDVEEPELPPSFQFRRREPGK